MSTTKMLGVRRKAIAVLTTVYKTESEEQMVELEGKIKDLLTMIRPDQQDETNSNQILQEKEKDEGVISPEYSTNDREQGDTQSHIGEIKKPIKVFAERPNEVAGRQVSFLEDAMAEKKGNRLGRFGLQKPVNALQEQRKRRKGRVERRRARRARKGVPDVIQTTSSKEDDWEELEEDDLSSIGTEGTEPTYVSFQDRMSDFLRVRTLSEGASQDDPLEDLREDEKSQLPLRRWRLLRRAV